ncbi:hypothetical protein pdam_00003250 [Pocillopora damicornis]|uniref:Centrosomal protein of 290kDa coiled-coil region domain-containing protein n=1 Tax=Pocillopora damicornis TaxID=46731 RepID=A0A3M6THZ5_POCDA|nr:hypothetical protein pdam_00003250 [Pocillopora damicornis]
MIGCRGAVAKTGYPVLAKLHVFLVAGLNIISKGYLLVRVGSEAQEVRVLSVAGSVNPDSTEAEDVNKMIKLFEVTKTVMKVKSLQAELAAEEIVKAGGGDQEQELLEEIEHLKREIQQYRKYDGVGGDELIREIEKIENSKRALEQELNEKAEAYFQEKNKSDQMAARLDEAERENKSLKRDIERNKMDLRDLQRQFEQQRESTTMRRAEGSDFKEKISKKNKELSEYLDEIRILQEANDDLEERMKNTEKELQEATAEMDKMTDEYTKLKIVLQQSDMIIDDMRKERDALRAQVQDLRMQFSTKTDTDEQIMAAVNSKVEEWKAVLAAKEIELEQYQSLVQELKQQVAGLQMDADKTSLAMLQQAVAEKDEQIENLKKELEKASSDMHGVASYVEEVKALTEKGVPSAYQQKRIRDLNSTLQKEQLEVLQFKDRMIMAEKAAAMKDKQLNDLLARMMQYERNQRLEGEVEKNEKQIEKYKSDMKKIETENKELKDENKQLEVGMREILAQLREHAAAQGAEENKLVQVPALEKLMAMIESRNAVGQYDTTLQLKAQIEQLSGRNEELRHELHNAREETAKAIMQLERKKTKIEDLEKDIKVLKEIGEGAVKLQPMPLPQGMTPSSTEIIASLNEHLIQVLQEVSLKEQLLEKMEKDLEMFKRKFSVILHQKGLLYADFMKEKENWEEEKKAIEEDKASTELAREHDKIRLMEFERLLDTLEKDEDKQKKRLGEMTRKVTVLRVNEKSLSRRYTAMQEVEAALRKENKRYKNDVVAMETAITERLGYLQRHKEMSTYKIGVLQQALDESVLATELEAANKQYNELTAKYRDVIQRENSLVARSAIVDNLEADLKALEEREADLKREMTSLKERNHSLEQMVNELLSKEGGEGGGDTSIVRQEEIDRISRKLATLEMKELNERERADHATRKYEQVQSLIKQLEERNVELEQKFAEDTHVAVTRRVQSLEESESKLKVEVSRLKEVAEVASHQTEAIKAQQESQDRELTSLRKQLYDMQMESDDKTIIGKLHHHIVALQVSEGTAVRKLEAAMQKLSRQEAHVLRLERKIDEKDQALYHAKTEARNKAKFLKRTIQDLRRQYSGALPLMKQEKFAETMRSLHEDKHKLEGELKKARTDREAAEDKLSELQLQHDGLQELMGTLKDGKGAAKVTEWHAKMGEIRLQDLKLNRAITRLQEELKHLENMTKVQERTISDLEDENVQLAKEHEERQLLWEQREVELERTIDKLEKQQEQLADAAAKFEEATGSIPDPDLPVANQLELAIRNIKEHIRIIVGTREESRALKKKYEELDQAFKQSEERLTQKDKEAKTQNEQHKAEIQLLQDRLHLETDETFRRKKTFHMDSVNDDGPPVPSHKQLARLSELEEMVTEQDNALAVAAEKYKKSRNEISKMKKDHEEEVNSLKQQMARKNEDHSKEITRLNNEKLERDDRIMEQSKEIEVLKDELELAKEASQRAPSKTMKHLVERLRNQLALKEKQQKAHAKKAEQQANVQHIVEKETAGLQARLEELQERMEKLKKELRKQKEKESNFLGERDKLKQELSKKDSALLKLGRELKELETVQEQLEKKEEELRTERNTLAQERAECEKLRERVKSLQEKIKQFKQKSSEDSEGGAGDDKPIVEEVIKEDRAAVVSEGVARWEDNKKWQQKVETLKGKLAEKTRELEKAEKTIGMLRDAVSRAEKDKAGLHSRLKSSAKSSTGGQALVTNEVVQDLRQNIFKLEEENQELRRQKVLGHDKQMEALELRNKQLVEHIEDLERDLAGRMAERRTVDHADADMYRDMYQRNQSLQKQLLEAKEARVEDLQEYVEILKAELEASKKREKARKKSLGTGMGGQSVEDLERVIAAMRRVVERLQGENDQLKKTVGAGGPQYGEVLKENKRLKHELEKAKVSEKTQSSRGGSSQGNTARLVTENEKLLKDLKKEMEKVEKLKTANANLEQRKEELVKELEQLHQRLSASNMDGLDSKEWKSVVLPKIYEEKMQKLEAELEKKTNLLKDIKTYLKAAANRETELMKKQQELEEKVTILERFPANIKGDSDLVKELQQTRLRLASLESEKEEILHEVRQLRKMGQAGDLPRDLDNEEVLEKLRNYDRMMAEDVELRTRLKTVELERDRTSHEVSKLRKELEAFDPAFFEEIEDLKYNYQKAVERNVLYERQLRQMSRQFGVDVNIPTED